VSGPIVRGRIYCRLEGFRECITFQIVEAPVRQQLKQGSEELKDGEKLIFCSRISRYSSRF
jgi:hypothetical protein